MATTLNTANDLVTLKPRNRGVDTPANIVAFLIRLQVATKMFHWQTRSYAAHTATGKLYDEIVERTDSIIETYMGTYGRIRMPSNVTVPVPNMTTKSMKSMLRDGMTYLSTRMPTDSHIATERDELLKAMATTLYLISMR